MWSRGFFFRDFWFVYCLLALKVFISGIQNLNLNIKRNSCSWLFKPLLFLRGWSCTVITSCLLHQCVYPAHVKVWYTTETPSTVTCLESLRELGGVTIQFCTEAWQKYQNMRQIKAIFFFFKWFCVSFSSLDVLELVVTSLRSRTLGGADLCPVAWGVDLIRHRCWGDHPTFPWRTARTSGEKQTLSERSWEGEQKEVKSLFLHRKVFASISAWLAYKRTM